MPTIIGDLILAYFDDAPAFYARIEDISPDRKKGWYHVRLLVLAMPAQEITWILKEDYISGEPFTMGGHPMRLEKLPPPGQGIPEAKPAVDVPAEKNPPR